MVAKMELRAGGVVAGTAMGGCNVRVVKGSNGHLGNG